MSVLRVRTVFAGIQGAPYLSTMYFITASAGGGTQTEATNANAAVGAYWTAVDNALISGMTWATDPSVADLSLSGALIGTFPVTPVSGVGATAGILSSPALQALNRWNTAAVVGGRLLKGRTYIPGIPTANISGGAPSGAWVGTTNTAAAALIADANSNFAVWSRRNSAAAVVQSGSLWTQFAVLRSRRD